MNRKKPVFWIVIAIVAVCLILAVVFLIKACSTGSKDTSGSQNVTGTSQQNTAAANTAASNTAASETNTASANAAANTTAANTAADTNTTTSTNTTADTAGGSDAMAGSPLSKTTAVQTADMSMDDKVSAAAAAGLLQSNKDTYEDGECAGEGHIILGYEQTDETVKAYTLTMYGSYGFEDGNFVKVSGSGAIPAMMTFSVKDGILSLSDIEYAADGSEYTPSIKKMFPEKYQKRALNISDKDTKALTDQEQAYAKAYLQLINRTATIGTAGDFTQKLPDITTEASNEMLNYTEKGYPYWLGTRETIEDGVRYIYETSIDKTTGDVLLTKTVYDTKQVAEQFRLDPKTGKLIQN